MNIPNQTIRELAIALLDDEDGINDAANQKLTSILADSGNMDILKTVSTANARWFLNEDDADILRGATIAG
jgi:hypothetical protein